MRGLCAIDPIRSGQVVLNGRPCAFHTYRDAVDAGICYLTEDRKTQGLFLEMSIKNNMSSANMKGVSHGIWLDDKLERSLANRFVEQLAIKIPGIEYPISSLSGGNHFQQCSDRSGSQLYRCAVALDAQLVPTADHLHMIPLFQQLEVFVKTAA